MINEAHRAECCGNATILCSPGESLMGQRSTAKGVSQHYMGNHI